MPDFPTEFQYAKTHEWVKLDGYRAKVGITDYAQTQLGDVVYVELPEVGTLVNAGEDIAVVESVKAASDIYAPVAGTVVECNDILDANPESVNEDPFGEGWFFVIQIEEEALSDDLLTAEAYESFCQAEGE